MIGRRRRHDTRETGPRIRSKYLFPNGALDEHREIRILNPVFRLPNDPREYIVRNARLSDNPSNNLRGSMDHAEPGGAAKEERK